MKKPQSITKLGVFLLCSLCACNSLRTSPNYKSMELNPDTGKHITRFPIKKTFWLGAGGYGLMEELIFINLNYHHSTKELFWRDTPLRYAYTSEESIILYPQNGAWRVHINNFSDPDDGTVSISKIYETGVIRTTQWEIPKIESKYFLQLLGSVTKENLHFSAKWKFLDGSRIELKINQLVVCHINFSRPTPLLNGLSTIVGKGKLPSGTSAVFLKSKDSVFFITPTGTWIYFDDTDPNLRYMGYDDQNTESIYLKLRKLATDVQENKIFNDKSLMKLS